MIFKNKIGLGTSFFGNTPALTPSHQIVMHNAVNLGYRLFDTGENYSDGRTETMLGNSIVQSTIDRTEFELVTKLNPVAAFSPAAIEERLHRSLERLQTNYLDSYLLHWIDVSTNIEMVVSTFSNLIDAGLVRHVGISNVSLDELKKWRAVEEQIGVKNKLEVVQFRYNLTNREADLGLHDYLKDENLTAMPHSVFGGGRIRGWSRPPYPPGSFHGDFWANSKIRALKPIADSIGATVPQLIIAFSNLRYDNSIAIPKSFKEMHLKDNLLSVNFAQLITPQIYDEITLLFPVVAA